MVAPKCYSAQRGYVPEDRRNFTELSVFERSCATERTTHSRPWTPDRLFSIFPNPAEMRGRAVLFSEQNIHFAAAVCDRTNLIGSGNIRFAGTTHEALSNATVRDAYLAV
jgi:ABC-type branched-subunit amino acid transport system ATPase component